MRLAAFVLVAACAFGPGLAAGTAEPGSPGQSGQAATAAAQEAKPASSPSTPDGQLPVSLDRIKSDLERKPVLNLKGLNLTPAPPEAGTHFRVRVEENRFRLPTLAEYLTFPPTPVAPGGLYNYEIMQMLTPEAVRGSAPFSNREMAWVAATSMATALAMQAAASAVARAREAWRAWQEEQARQEVQQDLDTFKREVAAEQAGTDAKADPASATAAKPGDKTATATADAKKTTKKKKKDSGG